jgi:hypothetical protein
MYEYIIILILSPVEVHLHIGGAYCLHIQDRTASQASNQHEIRRQTVSDPISLSHILYQVWKERDFYTDRICDQIKSNRIVKVISRAPSVHLL